MRVLGTISRIYPVQSGESLHGSWKFVDAVVRQDECIITEDGKKEPIIALIAIRMWGKKADAFIAEKKLGDSISAEVFPDCRERVSKLGKTFPCNDNAFECYSWDPAPQV